MRTGIIISSLIIVVLIAAVIIRLSVANKGTSNENNTLYSHTTSTGEVKITISNKWQVPEALEEISAISYIDNQHFACIQDELGEIFIYNTSTNTIEKEIPFADADDYEGLALNGDTAYVLRADGQIFEVGNYRGNTPVVKEYKTGLTEEQDTEGLAFDKANNRLLIAIKGKESENDDYKGIYAFDLATRKMIREPVFRIDLKHEAIAGLRSGKKKKKSAINPSEIAVHPLTGNIFITDGGKPGLLILDKTGNVLSVTRLDKKDFSQPEGIAFSPDGKLFISNEGSKRPGNILEVIIR